MKKQLILTLAAILSLSLTPSIHAAEAEIGEEDIVERIYTLENATNVPIQELYVYESKGENLVPDGLAPGEQVQVEVAGRYLHTPKETLYTVEFATESNAYRFETLHVEDLFQVLYLTGADEVSSATAVSFVNPDGSPQDKPEGQEEPGEDDIVKRTYTLENAMEEPIKELYVYKSKGENLVPDGLAPGEQVQAEVFGHYLHTPKETLYTVEFVTETGNYAFKTLHIEDLFDVLYLTGTVDEESSATVVAFAKPEA